MIKKPSSYELTSLRKAARILMENKYEIEINFFVDTLLRGTLEELIELKEYLLSSECEFEWEYELFEGKTELNVSLMFPTILRDVDQKINVLKEVR